MLLVNVDKPLDILINENQKPKDQKILQSVQQLLLLILFLETKKKNTGINLID